MKTILEGINIILYETNEFMIKRQGSGKHLIETEKMFF